MNQVKSSLLLLILSLIYCIVVSISWDFAQLNFLETVLEMKDIGITMNPIVVIQTINQYHKYQVQMLIPGIVLAILAAILYFRKVGI